MVVLDFGEGGIMVRKKNCFKDVSRKFQGCFEDVLRIFQGCLKKLFRV